MMNVKPRTIFTGDNLPVLRGIEAESVDMVYARSAFLGKVGNLPHLSDRKLPALCFAMRGP